MKIIFRKTFARDLRKLKDRKTLDAIEKAINAALAADRLMEIPAIEAMSDHPGCFRIRVGRYRIGVFVEDDKVELVRCLHRREIYRFFP